MKKVSVTVGIPAHNEAENILNLLQSILKQKMANYQLRRIIVICDGTTDNTDKKVAKFALKHPSVKVVSDGKRKGKMQRLKQLYKMNRSDFLFIFDGDVVLSAPHVIENMIGKFTHKNIGIVCGNDQPVAATTFIGKLINTWAEIWYLSRVNYNNGDNIHNVKGCIMALRKDFAKSITFPEGVVSDAQYIYLYAKQKRVKFAFANDAVIYYRKPSTLFDYLLQEKRSGPEPEKLVPLFGTSVRKNYFIPREYKYKAVGKMLLHNPVDTFLSTVFYLSLLYIPTKWFSSSNSSLWKRVTSTKEGIPVPF